MSALSASLRGRHILAIACLGCTGPAPYVTVPMTAATSAPAGLSGSSAADAAPKTVFRPLPPEPAAPEHSSGCKRQTACRPEEDQPVPLSFPPPFERCLPHIGKGTHNASFSAKATRDARIDDGHTCCYVEFSGCGQHAPPIFP